MKAKIAICILNLGIETGQNELSIVMDSKEGRAISVYATLKNLKELFESPQMFILSLQEYFNGSESVFDESLDELLLNKEIVKFEILIYDDKFACHILNNDLFESELG